MADGIRRRGRLEFPLLEQPRFATDCVNLGDDGDYRVKSAKALAILLHLMERDACLSRRRNRDDQLSI